MDDAKMSRRPSWGKQLRLEAQVSFTLWPALPPWLPLLLPSLERGRVVPQRTSESPSLTLEMR